MKGVMGCNADWLEPGQTIGTENGQVIRILRKVDLDAAIAIAPSFQPVPGECFYEVEVDLLAGRNEN